MNAKMRSVNKTKQSLVKFVNFYFLLHEKKLLRIVCLSELSHILLTRSSFIVCPLIHTVPLLNQACKVWEFPLKKLLIVKQILPVGTIEFVELIIWRIYMLM